MRTMGITTNQLRVLWPKMLTGPSFYLAQKSIKRWPSLSLLKRLHAEEQSK
ncbi:hypothetical protein Gotur_006937 [Gossypium turneri]